MDGTILQQGRFVSTGADTIVQIPANADFMWVRNYTKSGVAGDANIRAINSYWQRGMALGGGTFNYYANGGEVVTGANYASGGFTLYDPSGQSGTNAAPILGPAIATTATTNATRPVVSTGTTPQVGQIVRLSNTAQTDVNGIDMVVSAVTPGVNFTLLAASNALANIPGAIGGAGFYRVVSYPLFYPRKLYITSISQAVNAVVTTAIAHGLTVGQEVRFKIPAVSGMVQLSSINYGITGVTILSVIDDYSFTINVDTTSFTAFTWPTIAQMPSDFPVVNPVGEDTATSLAIPVAQFPTIGGVQIFNTQSGILADATVNTGYLGMILGFSAVSSIGAAAILNGPAGAANDVIYWVAGKSTYGGL